MELAGFGMIVYPGVEDIEINVIKIIDYSLCFSLPPNVNAYQIKIEDMKMKGETYDGNGKQY